MLTLTLNGVLIPIPRKFSMQLTWKSQVCDFGKIPSGYGLGLSIPINEYTSPIFGNPQRFAKYRAANYQKFSGFEARFSGLLLMAGSLSLTSAQGGNYDFTLIDMVGILGEEEQERSILEFPSLAATVNWVNRTEYTPDNSPYCCFPVMNNIFLSDKGVIVERTSSVSNTEYPYGTKIVTTEYDVLRLLHLLTGAGQQNNKNVDHSIKAIAGEIDISDLNQSTNTYMAGQVTVVSPFFYLTWLLSNLLKASNFFIGENYIDQHADLRKLCIYNTFDFTKTTFTTTTEERDVYIGNDETGTGEQMWESTGFVINKYHRSYTDPIKPTNHLPKMKLGEVLISTQNLVNVVFHFLPNSTVNILSREEIIAGAAIDLNEYFVGTWEIGEKKYNTLKFAREHDKNDLIFSEQFTDISDRKADIGEPVADFDALAAIETPFEGEIRYLINVDSYCEYKWYTPEVIDETTKIYTTTDVLGWQKITIGYQNGWHKYGRKEEEEIKTAWSTCYGYGNSVFVLQKGNMNAWRDKQQSFSPRLLFSKANNTGGNSTNTLSLDYEKTTIGLLPVLWKNTAQWWAEALPVSGKFDFSVNVLKHVIYNICSKFRTREGEFLIEEMNCEIYVDRIGTATIKGYKI